MLRPRMLQFSGAIAACALSTGCAVLPSHLHNADDAAAARKAQAEFAAYEEGAPGMYQAMLTNLDRFRVEQDRVLAELATNRDRAQITRIVANFTTADLDTLKANVDLAVDRVDGRIKIGVEKYFADRKAAIGAQQDAKQAIARLNKAVADSQQSADRWSKAIGLINKGLAKAASPSAETMASLNDAATATVEYRKADGSMGTTTIGAILQQGVDATGPDGELLSTLLAARGIEGTIMTLGLDLARVNQRAADARLAQLSRRAHLYEDAYSAMELARALVKTGDLNYGTWTGSLHRDLMLQALQARHRYAAIGSVPADQREPLNERILAFTGGLGTITGRLAAVRRIVVGDVMLVRTEQILALGSARLDHEDSIVNSRVADESWRAVIRSGLAGLVTYHAGGFTAEDAANIIRIAQAIALAFIAGGVQ